MIRVFDPQFRVEYEVYGNCPVQGFGTVAGREIYFRARHEAWSFDVADHKGALPSDGRADADGFYREGDYTSAGVDGAGYMPFEVAVQIIEQCLCEYIHGLNKIDSDVPVAPAGATDVSRGEAQPKASATPGVSNNNRKPRRGDRAVGIVGFCRPRG
jgi:hypothetical protein